LSDDADHNLHSIAPHGDTPFGGASLRNDVAQPHQADPRNIFERAIDRADINIDLAACIYRIALGIFLVILAVKADGRATAQMITAVVGMLAGQP
jgi:hypothetical protein